MFKPLRDPDTGKTYTPVSKVGDRTTYEVDGKTIQSRARHIMGVAYDAAAQGVTGAIPDYMQPMALRPAPSTRRGKKHA